MFGSFPKQCSVRKGSGLGIIDYYLCFGSLSLSRMVSSSLVTRHTNIPHFLWHSSHFTIHNMRCSKSAVTTLLQSTIFTAFQAKSVAVADIFDSTNGDKLRATNDGKNTNIDTGILVPADASTDGTSETSGSGVIIASTCDAGFVDCLGGLDRSNSAKSCFESCAGKCCQGPFSDYMGYDACVGFTGKVCKDGSCYGKESCYDANILSVVNSCKGAKSCRNVGTYHGESIISIVDSCHGRNSCFDAAAHYGSIGSITDSCNYSGACAGLAGNKGKVGDVTSSCNTDFACYRAAYARGYIRSIATSCTERFSCFMLGHTFGKVGDTINSCKGTAACKYGLQNGGSIGSIIGSCNEEKSCYGLGRHGGHVGDIKNACTASNSCSYGAADGGAIGNISKSCTGKRSCNRVGQGAGVVGHVTESCTLANSCQFAGYSRGAIGSISSSCNAEQACERMGSEPTGRIDTNLMSCCNEPSVCILATELTLPAQCNSKVSKYNTGVKTVESIFLPPVIDRNTNAYNFRQQRRVPK